MSHVATLNVVVRDLDSLKKAVEACGLEFMEGQTSYRWYGRWVNDYHGTDAAYRNGIDPSQYGNCLHAIRLPGDTKNYEAGVVANPNGDGYILIWDFFGSGQKITEKLGGQTGIKLTNEYVKAVTIKQLQSEGHAVTEHVDENGDIIIEGEEYIYN